MKRLCEYDEYGPGMGFSSMKAFMEEKPYPGMDMIVAYLRKAEKHLQPAGGHAISLLGR